jgi:hypothetical protein
MTSDAAKSASDWSRDRSEKTRDEAVEDRAWQGRVNFALSPALSWDGGAAGLGISRVAGGGFALVNRQLADDDESLPLWEIEL